VATLRDRTAFFRRGTSGTGRELLTDDELAVYRDGPLSWHGSTC